MNEDETKAHIETWHAHALPSCFQKRDDTSWSAVHKLVHDLAHKRGAEPHWSTDPFREGVKH